MLRKKLDQFVTLKIVLLLLLFLLFFIFFFLQGEWDVQQKKGHFVTLKRANIGPIFNFTTYTYTHIVGGS